MATYTAANARKLLSLVKPLCAAAIAAFGMMVVPVPSYADGGCIPGDTAGQVPRNARPGDNVCVNPEIAATVQQVGVGLAGVGGDGAGRREQRSQRVVQIGLGNQRFAVAGCKRKKQPHLKAIDAGLARKLWNIEYFDAQ